MENLSPIFGLICGILLIVFREKVAQSIEIGFKKFPVYDRSVFDFSVKPVNVVFIGAILIFTNSYFLLAQIV